MRIDLRPDQDVTHCLRDWQQRDFISGFRLVVDTVRRAKEQRLDPQGALEQALGEVQFDFQLRPGDLVEVRVGVSVVANLVCRLLLEKKKKKKRRDMNI